MKYKAAIKLLILFVVLTGRVQAQRVMENLGRGLVAVNLGAGNVYVSWRLLATDPDEVAFNIYRITGKGKPVKVNKIPLTQTTDFEDKNVNLAEQISYFVKPVLAGKEQPSSQTFVLQAQAPVQPYWSVPVQLPEPGEINGQKYSYSANDASVGDLDGDGEYEIVLKWEPSNARNPPQTGLTGNQLLDAYKLDGTRLWRIDLGKNIRSGAAYTQFLVYDFDGDGKAEMICKTADGSIDGKGRPIGDPGKDWRKLSPPTDPMYGKIAEGPEYLTVFDGETGAALATKEYVPTRYPLDGWGGIGGNGGNDNTASRSDRFTAGVAYLDGKLPSAVMVRGWYGRTVVAAWDWRQGQLRQRWVFDSKDEDNPYSGMGNHSLSVADVDMDGRDEICVGAMTIDDNGKGLYTTGLRHGDALHLGDLDPGRPGLEVFGVHESEGRTEALKTPGVAQFDAQTGKILFSLAPGVDVGRGIAADIDPRYPGLENWGGPGGLRNVKGETISQKVPASANFAVWWDADYLRELLDKNYIDKWDWHTETSTRLLTATGSVANNGTKATPALSADILGDWREEVIWRSADNKELRIYTTTIPAKNRLVTLMHDPQYRLGVAWQNVSYNQPPHTSFYLGAGMAKSKRPAIQVKQLKKKIK